MKSLAKLKKIKGDASFREFYRNKENKSIVVLSKKEKLKNLLIYDAINKILIKNKIYAPNLLSENYVNNYIEINDLGDQTLFQVLKKKIRIKHYDLFRINRKEDINNLDIFEKDKKLITLIEWPQLLTDTQNIKSINLICCLSAINCGHSISVINLLSFSKISKLLISSFLLILNKS